MSLVRSRYQYPLVHSSQTAPELPYDFQWLQRDVSRTFIVGRSFIYSVDENLKKPFMFYKPKPDILVLGISLADVEAIEEHLPSASGLKV